MHKAIVLATALLFSACGKKDENKGAGATPGAATQPAGGGGAAPAAPAAAAGKATCDTILGKSIRDKFFANHKIENVDFPVKHAGKCKITTPEGKDFEIDAACESFMKNAKDQMIAALKKQFPDFKEVPGAGDIVITREIGSDTNLIQFTGYNKGSHCMISGTLPTSVDAQAFFTEWLAALPSS